MPFLKSIRSETFSLTVHNGARLITTLDYHLGRRIEQTDQIKEENGDEQNLTVQVQIVCSLMMHSGSQMRFF